MSTFARRALAARRHSAAMQDPHLVREAESNVHVSRLTEADLAPEPPRARHYLPSRSSKTACGLMGFAPNTTGVASTLGQITCPDCRSSVEKLTDTQWAALEGLAAKAALVWSFGSSTVSRLRNLGFAESSTQMLSITDKGRTRLAGGR